MGQLTNAYVVGYVFGAALTMTLKWLGNSYEAITIAVLLGALVTLLFDRGGGY